LQQSIKNLAISLGEAVVSTFFEDEVLRTRRLHAAPLLEEPIQHVIYAYICSNRKPVHRHDPPGLGHSNGRMAGPQARTSPPYARYCT
jgi:hypothetical protein